MTHRRELDEELSQHLETLAKHLEKTEGLTPTEANREARLRFGDPEQIVSQCIGPTPTDRVRREASRLALLFSEVRYAIRGCRKNPGFSAVTILTLALGIGVTTAIYSVFQGVILRPLPFASPGELVELGESNPLEGVVPGGGGVSGNAFADWKERQNSFQEIAAWEWDSAILEVDGEAISLGIARSDIDLFKVLGVAPVLGRFFEEGDAVRGQQPTVVVLSFDLWRDRLGADPGVIGITISLDGTPREVIGVMQPESRAPGQEAELWLPKVFGGTIRWDRHRRNLVVYARLKPGLTERQARSEMDLIAIALEEEFPDINENWRVWSAPLSERVIGNSGSIITVAFAAVVLVLIVACVNIANLFLARAASRHQEIAVRVALGATTRQLATQLLTESMVLSLAGAALGFVLAGPVLKGLVVLQPDIIPRSGELSVDLGALGFAIGVAVLTGLLFGLVPLRSALVERTGLGLTISGNRSVSSGKRDNRFGAVLIAVQMGLTVVLLSGGALLARSMWNLSKVDPGFESVDRLAARIFVNGSRYEEDEELAMYIGQVLEKVGSLPGVTTVGASSALPMDPLGINYDLPIRIGGTSLPDNQLPQADFRLVTPEFFNAIGSEIVRGVSFAEVEPGSRRNSIVINQTMARRFWEGEDPVGTYLQTPVHSWDEFEVVGIVEDTHYYGLSGVPVPEMYVSLLDWPSSIFTVVASVSGSAGSVVEPLRRSVLEVDASQPAHSVVTLESLVADSVATQRFYAVVLGAFSVVALILSVAGIYGVMSYWVSQRTKELGVRLALGAQRAGVLRLVLGRGLLLTSIGAIAGFAISLGATRTIQSVLFAIGDFDPLVMFSVPALLVVAALFACLVPALRAMMVDPVECLRED